VQVGTASFIRPTAALEVLEQMEAHLREMGARSLDEVRGRFGADGRAPRAESQPAATSRGRRIAARPS